MATPEDLEKEAARLEDELAVHTVKIRTKIAALRQLAARQRQLDEALEALDDHRVLTSSTPVLVSPRLSGAMPISNVEPPPPPDDPNEKVAKGFKIALKQMRRFGAAPLWKALQTRRMSIAAYARLRQAMTQSKKPSPAAVMSWMDSGPNGRSIPEAEARFAETYFGRDSRGQPLVPADNRSWPHGIQVSGS